VVGVEINGGSLPLVRVGFTIPTVTRLFVEISLHSSHSLVASSWLRVISEHFNLGSENMMVHAFPRRHSPKKLPVVYVFVRTLKRL
jgi:hypothetical protein